MKLLTVLPAAVLAATAVSGAFAANNMQQGPAFHHQGFTLSANLGYGGLVKATDNFPPFGKPSSSKKTQSNSFIYNLGISLNKAFRPNMLIGFELGYNALGETKYEDKINFANATNLPADRNVTSSAISTLLTATYFFKHNITFTGKAGFAYITENEASKASYHDYGFNNVVNRYQFVPEIAASVGYCFNEKWSANVGAQYTFKGNKVASTMGFLAGVSYHI